MKNKFLLILLLIILSCNENQKKVNGINVIIVNKTNKVLKDITFHTSEKVALLPIHDIKPGDSCKVFYLMKKHQIDGEYILNFSKNDSISESIEDGYYSNGFSSNDWIKYEIKNDTVITNFEF